MLNSMIPRPGVSRCEFTPNCLPKQLSPGTGETNLVAGEVKCSPGRIWSISGYRRVEKLLGDTQKCDRVGFTGCVTEGCYYQLNFIRISN